MTGYVLVDEEGGQYSTTAGDYWSEADDRRFVGCVLVKQFHAWRTLTGCVVYAPRVIKSDPTVRDLRRLARAAGR